MRKHVDWLTEHRGDNQETCRRWQNTEEIIVELVDWTLEKLFREHTRQGDRNTKEIIKKEKKHENWLTEHKRYYSENTWVNVIETQER